MKNVRKIYHMESTPDPTCEEAKADLAKTEDRLRINEGSIAEKKIENEKFTREKNDLKEAHEILVESIKPYVEYRNKLAQEYNETEKKITENSCSSSFGILCPVLSARIISINLQLILNEFLTEGTEDKIFIAYGNFQDKITDIARSKVELEKLETHSTNLKDRIILNKRTIEFYCKTFKSYKAKIKSKECKKIKEKINKLKNQYFKLSKDMLGIQYGISGIKFNKLQQKILKKSKPMIEEAIKKIGDLKRHVVGTEDEAQFFTIQSEVKSMLAQNIKEQSVVEDNLKNLLVKKEKTNKIIKKTKKVLNHKIKQSIKLCN